jgi:hypothetical protein
MYFTYMTTIQMYNTYMYMYNVMYVHSLGCCGCIKVLIEQLVKCSIVHAVYMTKYISYF